MKAPQIESQTPAWLPRDAAALGKGHVPRHVAVAAGASDDVRVPRLQRRGRRGLDALHDDHDLEVVAGEVLLDLPPVGVKVREALQLLRGELLVAELGREPAQGIRAGTVAAVALQHPRGRERGPARLADAAVAPARLAVHLALQRPRPGRKPEVLQPTLGVREHCGAVACGGRARPLGLGRVGDGAPRGGVKASRGLPGRVPPGVEVLRLEVLRRERAPGVDAVDDCGRQGEQQGPTQLVVRLLEAHRHHLAAARALHHRDVAAHVGLDQGVLDAQVADAEHQVVRAVYAADDRLLAEQHRAGSRLRLGEPLEDDADEPCAHQDVLQALERKDDCALPAPVHVGVGHAVADRRHRLHRQHVRLDQAARTFESAWLCDPEVEQSEEEE
mmetsp:Transcript_4505/g.14574  ORF Transcript_4505/g.14574 Transcript_4505/m.14574 type:complete len:388 (-) Transcript_4505:688-1851(-)